MLIQNSIASPYQSTVPAPNCMNASEVETESLSFQMETLLNRVKVFGRVISLNPQEILMMDHFLIMRSEAEIPADQYS